MHERNEIHPQNQPKAPKTRRALNYQELKRIPVKLSLHLRATSGKAKTQHTHRAEPGHGIPGGGAPGGLGGPGSRGERRPQLLQTWQRRISGRAMTALSYSQWLFAALPALTSGRYCSPWEMGGIAPWKTQLSPEGMPAFCLLAYESLGVSPICSLQGLCQGRCGGLGKLLAETSSVQKPFGNTRACAGLVELLTLGTPPRTKGRGCLAGGGVEGVWRGLSGVP